MKRVLCNFSMHNASRAARERARRGTRDFDGKLNFMKYRTDIGNRWNGKWFRITRANASLTIWSAVASSRRFANRRGCSAEEEARRKKKRSRERLTIGNRFMRDVHIDVSA